jgi:hypothetical protein
MTGIWDFVQQSHNFIAAGVTADVSRLRERSTKAAAGLAVLGLPKL